MASNKVALITGGASGMGLAVATALSTRSNWTIHILDLQTPHSPLPYSTFHKCNVTDEPALAQIFSTIYAHYSRLDFVFANAGIAERANFYNIENEDDGPVLPVKGIHPLIDINLKSVITTTYLANYYMRKSPKDVDKSIVITASCGGLYPSFYSPIYTATKHAVVGFMRAIAPNYFSASGIRVNAICPGVVKTNLLSGEEWENFPEEYFTLVESIVDAVLGLVDGGIEVEGGKRGEILWGKALEVSGVKRYFREHVEFCDEGMKRVMGATDIEVLENVKQT